MVMMIFTYLSWSTTAVLIAGWWHTGYITAAMVLLVPLWIGWMGFVAYVYKLKDDAVTAVDVMASLNKQRPDDVFRQVEGDDFPTSGEEDTR